jgi:hypothetical protein
MTNKRFTGTRVSKQGRAAFARQAKKARHYNEKLAGCGSRLSAGGCYTAAGGNVPPALQTRRGQKGAARMEEKRRHIRFAQCKQAAALHIDGTQIWKQYEDLLIPQLRLTVFERALYSHLLRHSRLEGKRRLRITILWAARGTGLSTWAVRKGVRALAAKGALRLAERSKRGHVIEVRLPGELRAVRAAESARGEAEKLSGAARLEELNFFEARALREAIHAREGGRCFYCLRRVTAATRSIDHVIPQAREGGNSYANLVSSCAECNAQKCEWSAEDFLRWLFREGRLGVTELKDRLRAVENLAAGKLRPTVGERTQARAAS